MNWNISEQKSSDNGYFMKNKAKEKNEVYFTINMYKNVFIFSH